MPNPRPNVYRVVLTTPTVRIRLLAVFLSAVPIGMANLALILSVQHWSGSLRLAGALAAVFGAGNAIGLLLQGHLLDLGRPRRLILIGGVVSCSALVMLAAVGSLHPPTGQPLLRHVGLAVLAGVAGLAVPAVTTAVRAMLPQRLPTAATRTAAYALLAVLFQAALTVGPLLVSLAVVLSWPPAALVLAGTLLLTAAILYTATADAVPLPMRPVPDGVGASGWWRPGLGWVLAVNICTGFAAGVTAVAVPGIASAAGHPAIAGAAFSAAALGEVLGALGFGAGRWPGSPWVQLAVVLGGAATTATAIYLVAGRPWLLIPTMFVGGLLGAPTSVLISTLIDRVVPAHATARAYALLVCVGLLGGSVGNALVGGLAGALGVRRMLLGVPAVLLVAAALCRARRLRTAA